MDFFDEVYKKLTDTANTTVSNTERLTERAKLKFSLMREKSKLEESFKKLGELYYRQIKNGDVSDKRIALAYDRIEKSMVVIDELNLKISAVSNSKICASCGERLDRDMQFCHKCGKKVDSEEETKEAEAEE